MAVLQTLKQIVPAVERDIKDRVQPYQDISAIYLYGSFHYRNLDDNIKDYELGEVLDKKPDMIVVVPNIEEAIWDVGKSLQARDKNVTNENIEKVVAMRKDSPFYFNLQTGEDIFLQTNDGHETVKIPYKIGLIGEDMFLNMADLGNNIYLASRMSKFVNKVHMKEGFEEKADDAIDFARDLILDLTVKRLSNTFYGETLMTEYLRTTYLAESFRLPDKFSKKHDQIYESHAYNLKDGSFKPMGEIIGKILENNLGLAGVEAITVDKSFPDTLLKNSPENISRFNKFKLVGPNIESAKISFGKNRKTNKLFGGSNFAYVWRKIK